MAKTKISEYSSTANSNTDIASINIDEGCAPSGINNAIRALMAQLKNFQTGADGDSFNGPVGSTTPAAGAFTTLSSTGNTTLGDASTDTVTVNGTATFNASPVISVTDNTNAALRITQLGTGNALLVEDSSNPDSSPFVIDASGVVIAGYTANPNVGQKFNLVGNGTDMNLALIRYQDSAGGSSFYQYKSRGSVSSPTIVQSGDALGIYQLGGYDGSNFIVGALIGAYVDGTPGTNDMPGRLIFSTTADGALSPTEALRINNSQGLSTGGISAATVGFYQGKAITGGTTAWSNYNISSVQSGVTSSAYYYQTSARTQATAFTLPTLVHYGAAQGTIGAGSTVTSQYGFLADSSLTGATTNYGFYSAIASGSNRYNFYAAGTADNYFAGNVGIGSTSLTARNLYVAKTVTGATTGYGVRSDATFQSDVTSGGWSFYATAGTQATSFTISEIGGYVADNGTIGAGSTVNKQYGFYATSGLTGANYNYGFYGNIATGSNRWNLYMAGSASNFLGGILQIGSNTSTAVAGYANGLQVHASSSTNGASISVLRANNDTNAGSLNLAKSRGADPATRVIVQNGDQLGAVTFNGDNGVTVNSEGASIITYVDGVPSSTSMPGRLVFSTTASGSVGGTERMRIDSSGNVIVTGAGGLGYGTGSGGTVTQATSRTTGVTLNKTNGAITLVSAAGSTSWQSFTVTNSTVAATDVVHVSQKSGTDLYEIHVTAVAAGSFRISFKTTAGTTTEQPVFNFAVIKAVTA